MVSDTPPPPLWKWREIGGRGGGARGFYPCCAMFFFNIFIFTQQLIFNRKGNFLAIQAVFSNTKLCIIKMRKIIFIELRRFVFLRNRPSQGMYRISMLVSSHLLQSQRPFRKCMYLHILISFLKSLTKFEPSKQWLNYIWVALNSKNSILKVYHCIE